MQQDYRRLENCFAYCSYVSLEILTFWPNFGSQTTQNRTRVSTHSVGGDHTEHCVAF